MKVKTFEQIFRAQVLLGLRPIDGDPPPDDPGGGGGGGGVYPGLGNNVRKRYTSNVVISEEGPVLDVLQDVIFTACRGFLTSNAKGQIRINIKKPADYAYGISAFSGSSIDVDNAQPWVTSQKYYIVVDPHTDQSEVRQVTAAVYPTSQNSTTLTSDHPTEVTVTSFSGATGGSTPATATINFTSFVASTSYVVTLDGVAIAFTPGTGDTAQTIGAAISSAINSDPRLNRKFKATWVSGDGFITVTARFGTLTLNSALLMAHATPQADPTTAPTLTAVASGSLKAGEHLVAYAYRNAHGMTLLSPFKAITVTANQKITVTGISPPGGCTVVWYCSPEAGSTKLRMYLENDGSGFTIDAPLPYLSAPLPPDLNRTGTEIIRVTAVYSDRGEVRCNIGASNVIKGSFRWRPGGNRRKTINRIDFSYREQNQDYRLIELREQDDASIAKIKKTNNEKINGQAVNTYFQAKRLATSLLAEYQDADFFYDWSATRRAALQEEGDVVCITDGGSGVVNLPVMIKTIEVDPGRGGRPDYAFEAQKYYSTLYDDAVNELKVPVVSEL